MNKRNIKATLRAADIDFDEIYFLEEFKEMMDYNDEEFLASGCTGIHRNTLWRFKKTDVISPKGRVSPPYIIELDGEYSLHAIIHKDFGG